MDYSELPVGFAMALARNEPALLRYSALSPSQKSAILAQAHAAHSEEEMHRLVGQLGNSGTLE